NGKLELGKLKLSLWGQVRVEVGGLFLSDSDGSKIVSVTDAYFHIPFISILSGSPVLTFKMKKPALSVIKNKSGKLNVMALIKPAAPAPKATPSATGAEPKPAELAIPGIVARSRLGIELSNAVLGYKDEVSGLSTRVDDLNVVLKDISLSRPTQIEISANLDTKMGEKGKEIFTVKGPMHIIGKAEAKVTGGHIEGGTLSLKTDLDSIMIEAAGGMFVKKPGIPFNSELAMAATKLEIKIDKFNAKFLNAELNAKATIANFDDVKPNPMINFNMTSNDIDIKPWVNLIPLLKSFDLGGVIHMEATAKGPADKLDYTAKLKADALTAKAPMLKSQPRIDALVNIITDKVDSIKASVKAPGNELEISGKVVSFTKPYVEFDVSSPGMDLDQLVDWPPPRAKAVVKTSADGKTAGSEGTPPVAAKADFDAMLAPLRENKIAQAASALVNINIKMLKAYNVKMTDIISKVSLRDLTASVDQFNMKLWGGAVKATASAQLAPKVPVYKFNAKVDSLDAGQAVASQFTLFKNTLKGKVFLDMSGDGSSFNPDAVISNLKAKGSMKVQRPSFTTIDVGKAATEALNKAMEKVGEKIPQAKGKNLGVPAGREQRYEVVSSDFSISGGRFSSPNLVAKAAPNEGIDFKGNTEVGMKDFSIKARWEIVDTYNITRARDLSVEQSGIKVNHILAEGNQPVKLPINVGCTLLAPCYTYTEVPEYLAKVALGNVTGAVKGAAEARVKDELKKRAESLIQKAPPATQKKLEDLKKKFFK
ncbi:MAG: AsmA-like C-terminal region-containing protein, partial [Bdellovibrionota bacterium]